MRAIRRLVRLALGALVLLGATVSGAVAQHPLMGLPLADPAYRQLDALVRGGCAAARVSAFRPFIMDDVRNALRAAGAQDRCAGPVLDALTVRFLRIDAPRDSAVAKMSGSPVTFGAALTLQGTALRGGEMLPLWQDVRPTAEGDPSVVALARVRLAWDGGARIMAVTEAYGETERRNDPTVRAKRFRQTSGVIDFSEAYASGRLGPVVVSVGRSREAWLGDGGDPAESMVLSANGPALDRIALRARWPRFEFRALVASVNDVVLTPAADAMPDSVGTQRWHRMLIAHALTFRPSTKLELTLGETGLIPRQGGGVALNYANPFMLYQVLQNDDAPATRREGGVNLTAFGSVRANLGPASLQGDLVIDDIQIDSKDRRVYPDQIAWNVRGAVALPVALPTSVALQYRRAGSFTYLSWSYSNSWQQYDRPIGSELGPDADMARLSGEVWPSGRLLLSAGATRWRRGARRLDLRPTPTRAGHSGDPFPSVDAARPVVQSAWGADVGAEWMGPLLPISLRVEAARIDNVNNVPAATRTIARLHVSATYRFRYP